MQMAAQLRAAGAGVVVLSCSDPRLNPYQVLGIDPTLSEFPPSTLFWLFHLPARDACGNEIETMVDDALKGPELIRKQRPPWSETQAVELSMLSDPWQSSRPSDHPERLLSCTTLVRYVAC
jgi:hypothetical protein